MIQKSTLDFLKQLAKNNNREWFGKYKVKYESAKENIESFVAELIHKMNQHDQIETSSAKRSLYRIYRDVRFSADKTPYSPRFAGYLKRQKPLLRGGYYYWIKPGGSKIACGFHRPNPEDLKRVRQDIMHFHEEWLDQINSPSIQNTFGSMLGEKVKTSPKGFSKDDPAIDLLRFKQYWFEKSFSDEEVLSQNFVNLMDESFQQIRPFFDYMTEVLSTNVNGESLYH